MAVSVRDVALDILLKSQRRHIFVNLTLKHHQDFNALNDADKALTYHLIYGVLQNQTFLDYHIQRFLHQEITKLNPIVHLILRLAFYQFFFMERIPNHAIVNEAVVQCKHHKLGRLAGLVNAVCRKGAKIDLAQSPIKSENQIEYLAIKYSHPLWLIQAWAARWDLVIVEAMAAANNQVLEQTIRVNRLKSNLLEVKTVLEAEGIVSQAGRLFPEQALKVASGNMANHTLFQSGKITLQDEGAMAAVYSLDLMPGLRILDLCSAPGGKTALISEHLDLTDEIVAVELHEHRMNLLNETCQRLGVTNVTPVLGDATHLSVDQVGQFDRILLDAPCSGLGTIRSKPEIRWYRQPEDILEIATIQHKLLANAYQLLKPDGKLVYCTCSNEFAETQAIVSSQKRWKILSEQQLLPHLYGTEGFYIAVLAKTEN